MIWALWLGACEVPCTDQPPGAERDACTYAEVLALPASDGPEVLRRVQSLDDPVVRGAAVTRWVGQHARTLDPDLGRTLCETLEGPDQGQCLRRLQSAHLKR